MSLQRSLYRASRAVGDYNALKRGRLPKRLIRRRYHRGLVGLLRKMGVW